ncbi:acetate/propionate family kinase [Methyloligella solikamskensis]|uniref:Acetate kinase n=1 Tax=Methyloligella solikamskensis TaxID=1177756 RepID=A0ABW3J741_9HYPH
MTGHILLTFNPGSSTIKLGLYHFEKGHPERFGGGAIDLRDAPLRLRISEEGRQEEIPLQAEITEDLHDVVAEVLDWLKHHFPAGEITGVGHRVVHGGDLFTGPALITEEVEDKIAELTPLAPLHQPKSLRLIRAVRKLWPDVPQTASFDTAFHQHQSDVVRRFAIPRELFDEGIKRYGFHGLSYASIAKRLQKEAPELAKGKVVVAHLGSGASLCGLDGGVSRDTSMGFSTLDGIPMATRCGALDPGVLLHLLEEQDMPLSELDDMLYHRSGLLGLSGISADSRDLVESDAPAAGEALQVFAHRIAQTVAALATTLGGIQGLVFTAGIGQHQPLVRSLVCGHLSWMGVAIDAEANSENRSRIDGSGAKVAVLVMPTDEEQVIAEEALAVLPG